jgi:hypothetical protein
MKNKIHKRRAGRVENLKPFKKGFDPRRRGGPKNHELADFTINFKNALAKKVPAEKIAEILAKYILNGRPWAMQLGLEYLVEKPAQEHKHSGEIKPTRSLSRSSLSRTAIRAMGTGTESNGNHPVEYFLPAAQG